MVSGLLDAAGACGASFRFGAEVASINSADGRVSGVTLASGERLPADVVVSNRDVSAAYPLLRNEYGSRKAKEVSAKKFSAAVIAYNWSVGKHFDRLQHHNVFLSGRLPFFPGLCLHGQMCRLACAGDHASGAQRRKRWNRWWCERRQIAARPCTGLRYLMLRGLRVRTAEKCEAAWRQARSAEEQLPVQFVQQTSRRQLRIGFALLPEAISIRHGRNTRGGVTAGVLSSGAEAAAPASMWVSASRRFLLRTAEKCGAAWRQARSAEELLPCPNFYEHSCLTAYSRVFSVVRCREGRGGVAAGALGRGAAAMPQLLRACAVAHGPDSCAGRRRQHHGAAAGGQHAGVWHRSVMFTSQSLR